MRRYAEESAKPWFFLSAEHGRVHPDDWLEPFPQTWVVTTSESGGAGWLANLRTLSGGVNGLIHDVHASAA